MNKEAQEQLVEILKKSPKELSYDERAFLRARRSYLKDSQAEEYKSILDAKETAPKVEQASYQELLVKAKELGYKGPRMKRPELETYISDKQNNPFK